MAALMKVAREHHCRRLLLHCGLRPWLGFMAVMRRERERAERYHQVKVLSAVFVPWRRVVREREEEREKTAKGLCRKQRLRQSMAAWKKV